MQTPKLEQRGDERLLRDYLSSGCPDSFREIVVRYGPLVLSVCRRQLSNESLAEDAFQETFIVLATGAERIRCPQHLSSWLYGVAIRTSQDLARRNQKSVGPIAHLSSELLLQLPDAEIDAMTNESIESILIQELDQLPDRYRAPLVLCYMMGETHAAAAQKLAVPVGSISQRLRLAKKKLNVALRKRGVVVSITVIGWLLGQLQANASVPSRLIELTLVKVGVTEVLLPGPADVTATAIKSSTSQFPTWSLLPILLVVMSGGVVFLINQSVGTEHPKIDSAVTRPYTENLPDTKNLAVNRSKTIFATKIESCR